MALGFVTDRLAKRQRVVKGPGRSDDLYEMANLFPEDTGLPVTVWVSPRGRARHAARVKVCRVPGNKMVPTNTAAYALPITAGPAAIGRLINLRKLRKLRTYAGNSPM